MVSLVYESAFIVKALHHHAHHVRILRYSIVHIRRGEYWGELGFFRIELGKNLLGIEGHVCWATPRSFTVHNFPCLKDGSNCVQNQQFIDPSTNPIPSVKRRLRQAS